MSTVGIFQLGVVLTLKDLATSKLDEINKKWDTMRQKLGDTHEDVVKMDKAISNMKVGSALLGAGLTVGAFTKQFVDARMESSKLEANIKSLGVTSEEVDNISNSTSIMSAKLGIANETFLSGIYDIKSAISTLESDQLAGVSENLAMAAVATKGDLAVLSDLFGTTHAQFKSMYKESDIAFSQRFANTLAMSVQAFKTDGSKMTAAMQGLGASAASMGVTLEEQMVILGTLQNTMNPGVAGTAYRAFLSNVGKGFQDLGLNAKGADGKLKSMPLLLKDLDSKFKNAFIIDKNTGNSVLNLDARNMIKKAFGTEEAVAAIEALLPKAGSLTDAIQLFQDTNASGKAGTLEAMANANLDSMPAQLNRLSNGWKNLQGFIGKGLEGAGLKTFFRVIGDGLVYINQFLLTHPKFAKFIGVFLSISSVGLVVTGAFLLMKGAFAAFMLAVNVGLVSNPFGWIIIGVVAAIAALAAIIVYWDDIKFATASSIDYAGAKIEEFVSWINSGFNYIKSLWSSMPDWAKGLVAVIVGIVSFPLTIIALISYATYKYWDDITMYAGIAFEYIKNLGLSFVNFFIEVWNSLSGIAGNVWEGIKTIWSSSLDSIGTWLNSKIDFLFILIPESARKAGIGLLKAFGQGIIDGVQFVLSPVKSVLSKIGKFLPNSNAQEGPLSNLTGSGASLLPTFGQGITAGQAKGKSALQNALSSFKNLLPNSNANEGPLSDLTGAGQLVVKDFAKGIDFEAPKMNPVLSRFNANLKSDSKGILKSDQYSDESVAGSKSSSPIIQIGSLIGQLIMEGGKGNKSKIGEILAEALFEEIERHEEVVL